MNVKEVSCSNFNDYFNLIPEFILSGIGTLKATDSRESMIRDSLEFCYHGFDEPPDFTSTDFNWDPDVDY